MLTAPTSRRTTANRENAKLSTGPRTDAGKQRSSLNALRHGLFSHAAVLPTEDPAAYQLHCRRFIDELLPVGALEEHLVQSLADTAWRLNRIPALEAKLLAAALAKPATNLTPADPADPDLAIAQGLAEQTRPLTALSAGEQRLSRQFDRILNQLRDLQTAREQSEGDPDETEEAEETNDTGETPAGPGPVGFVLQKNSAKASQEGPTQTITARGVM